MGNVKRREATVTIYGGDVLDRLRHIERQFAAALESEKLLPRTNDEVPASESLADEHATLREEAEADAIHVVLRALKRADWRDLVEKCPPRDGNEEDAKVGVDESKFKDLLVPASLVSGLEKDDLEDLSDAEYDRLYANAFALNRAPAAAPKALQRPDSQQNRTSSGD